MWTAEGWWFPTRLVLFAADDDYRVPDIAVYRPEQASERGIDGTAELVVELRSPRDESYDKLDWYAAWGIAEVVLIHPHTREVERYTLRGGTYRLVQPDTEGMVTCQVLGVRLGPVEGSAGPRLRIHDEGTVTDC
ncbi:MAG: Uma2 family endonuclease [Acidimicrobiales bacterium]